MSQLYMANYIMLSEKNLIIEYHDGFIKAEKLIAFKKRQAAHQDYSPNFNILADLRFIKFTKRLEKVKKYINFLSEHKEIVGLRKVALIADNPESVTLATLYQYMQKDLPQSLNIFAKMENAISWLDLDISAENIKKILEDLRRRKQ